MTSQFPVTVAEVCAWSSEALYQACRFPHDPNVQVEILHERSPMTAKMKSKKYLDRSRLDWDSVRVNVMRWCLRAKLTSNWDAFGSLLLSTGDRPIVEESSKDDFWGARPTGDELIGRNVLGRLLMEVRLQLRTSADSLRIVEPPVIDDFLLLGRPVKRIAVRDRLSEASRVADVRVGAATARSSANGRHSPR